MKRNLLNAFLLLFISALAVNAQGEGVGIVITYDATKSPDSLLVGAAQVYAHSGIAPATCEPWTNHVGMWQSDYANGIQTMTNVEGTDQWTLTIDDIATFYAYVDGDDTQPLYDPTSTTNTIGMVFHDGSTGEGKSDDAQDLCPDQNGDIYIDITGDAPVSTWPEGVTAEYLEGSGVADFSESLEFIRSYPNPFTAQATITYAITESEVVKLTVYNSLGQEVRTLLSEPQVPGEYSVIWDGTTENGDTVTEGVYIYRLEIGDYATAGKLVKK